MEPRPSYPSDEQLDEAVARGKALEGGVEGLTPVQALGVALSVVNGDKTMEDAQEAAPGMLEHLQRMGFNVVRTS